ANGSTLQRLLLRLKTLPAPLNEIRLPVTVNAELPDTLASGPFTRFSVLPLARRTRSPFTNRLLPLRTLTSAPAPTVSVLLSSAKSGPALITRARSERSSALSFVVSVLFLRFNNG